jgi:MFS family permease
VIPTLLKTPGSFRVFWLGQSISLIGDQVTLIAIPLVAVQLLQASPAEMGYLTAAGWLPFLLLALFAGAWVDRRGRRRQVMVVADLGRALVIASIAVAYLLHILTLVHLFLVALLAGAFGVFFNVSTQSLFVSMVPREQYPQGQSLLHGSRAFSYVTGPALGGILVQLLSGPIALVVDAVSFIVSAASLLRISPTEPPASPRESGQLLAGVRFVFGNPIMRACLGATAMINLFNFAFSALYILFAVRDLHVVPGELGLILGGAAVGSLLASLITSRLSRRIGIGPAFILGCIVFPAPLLLVPFARGPHAVILVILFVAEFLSGVGVMVLDIAVGTVFAGLIPNELRSRVSGAYTVVNYGVRPVGALLGGFLGTTLGVRGALLVAAIGSTLGFLWLLPSPLPAMKDMPEPALPEVAP